MPKRIYPGETIGIIGATDAAAFLAQAAGRLGYKVISLVLEQGADNAVQAFVVDQVVCSSFDEETLRSFGKRAQVVMIESPHLSHQECAWLQEETYVCTKDTLVQHQHNRLQQKEYLDDQPLLVAPYAAVYDEESLTDSLEALGYPAQIKLVERRMDLPDQSLLLYGEEDFDQALELLSQGPALLETWLPASHKLSLTVIRNEIGEVLLYPLIEMSEPDQTPGRQYQYPSAVSDLILHEIHRQAYHLANHLELIGAMTLEYLVTKDGLLYLADLRLALTEASLMTLGMTTVSVYEATIRAVVGLPLPPVQLYSPAAVGLPLTSVQLEPALTQFMLRTDWQFVFLSNANDRYNTTLRGQIIIPGQSVEACQRQIDLAELYRQ